MKLTRALLLVTAMAAPLATGGCYHYTFEQRPMPRAQTYGPYGRERPVVRFTERVPTWFNGFVGNGRVDTNRYCRDPISTELKVTAKDVLFSALTLLIYTPHTLTVTCAVPEGPATARR